MGEIAEYQSADKRELAEPNPSIGRCCNKGKENSSVTRQRNQQPPRLNSCPKGYMIIVAVGVRATNRVQVTRPPRTPR